jgi:HAT1-interacting factor 1
MTNEPAKTHAMADPANEPLVTVTETEELPRTKEKMGELSQAASIHYSTKNYDAAAEHYADAVEIQAELNGEMAPENAELLFYYGRALYRSAVAKSDVLGNKVAKEEKKNKQPKAKKAAKAEAGEGSSAAKAEPKEESVETKPYFQLQGDENWTDSEDEDDDMQDADQEDDDDDLGNAYEIFELARVLYERQLGLQEGEASDKGKGKAELTPRARVIKERIADCHGFLVEISLENERFHDAISDARKALALQEELYPFEHENVTEAHYSLSLALEFASVSKVREDQTGQTTDASAEQEQGKEDEDGINWELRKEAAEQTDLAIQSLEARLKKEEAALSSNALKPEQKKEKQAIIEDKKGMLEDLKTRLVDLKSDPKKQEFDSIDSSVFKGLLGGLMGADAATQKAKLAEATKTANDVSSMVKKKVKAPAPAVSGSNEASSSKRKLEVDDGGAEGKRAKTEEPA